MRDGLGELTDSEREIFEERAAVAEYDGGLPRPIAESEAKREIGRQRSQREESQGWK